MILTKEAYSEVYEILNIIGKKYISKLPNKLFDFIKQEKLEQYENRIDLSIPLKENKISEEALTVIAMFNLNYWCEDEEEKKRLTQIYQKNEDIYQTELKEKYNTENLFKKQKIAETNPGITNETSMIVYKESILKRIFNKIKGIFMRK